MRGRAGGRSAAAWDGTGEVAVRRSDRPASRPRRENSRVRSGAYPAELSDRRQGRLRTPPAYPAEGSKGRALGHPRAPGVPAYPAGLWDTSGTLDRVGRPPCPRVGTPRPAAYPAEPSEPPKTLERPRKTLEKSSPGRGILVPPKNFSALRAAGRGAAAEKKRGEEGSGERGG